jgi:large subunit ribosomal protein L36
MKTVLNKMEALVKVRNSLRAVKLVPGSQVVRRRGRVYVVNKANPRWNTRQG